jgi:hypothetical protein
MPKSMPRRIDLLERSGRARPPRVPAEDLIADLERAAGLPPDEITPRYQAAWDAYCRERDRLLATAEEPPAGYRPDLPPAARQRRFLIWDHPRIGDAVAELLRAYIEMVGDPDRPPGRTDSDFRREAHGGSSPSHSATKKR